MITKGEIARIVIGVDPAVTSEPGSDSTGIIVAGLGIDGHGYILKDLTCKATPDAWARTVCAAYKLYEADKVVCEVNNGGQLVESVLKAVDQNLPVRQVHAARGKITRADPISALYEQGLIHHCGEFHELEDELCGWFPGRKSPDRLDACLVTGTLIETVAGQVSIEDVKAGEYVFTRKGLRRVVRSEITGVNSAVFTVIFKYGGGITGTANHPVWVVDKGFVPISELSCGDRLMSYHGEDPFVLSVYNAGGSDVYNLEVEGEHEYFANGVLVHNCVWALWELFPENQVLGLIDLYKSGRADNMAQHMTAPSAATVTRGMGKVSKPGNLAAIATGDQTPRCEQCGSVGLQTIAGGTREQPCLRCMACAFQQWPNGKPTSQMPLGGRRITLGK